MNSVVLIGRLSKDVDLKFIPATGMAVGKILLAVDKDMFGEKKQQAVAEGKTTADFISVTVFGKQAENAANYITKGSKCAIHGRINTGSYTNQEGQKRYTTDVIADRIEFLDSKDKGQARPTNDEDEDIFQPVEDDEEIPF